MKIQKLIFVPVVIGGLLILCLAGSFGWRLAWKAHASAQIASINHGLKVKPAFSDVRLAANDSALGCEVRGTVPSVADFIALTNMLSAVSPAVPIEVWINWPSNANHTGGTIATTIGQAVGINSRVSDDLSSASFFLAAVFLFSIFAAGCWYFWKRVCLEHKPRLDLALLISAPFLSLSLMAAVWWNSPIKDLNWNPWLVFFSFFITTALFTSSLYSMVCGRYRLLSSLGIIVVGLAVLPECLIATTIIFGFLVR
jgi:hypothetical protein